MISDWRIRGVGLGSGIFKADTAAPEKPPAIQDQGKMLSPWEDTPHKNHKTLLGYVYVHETGQIFNWLKIQVFTRYSVHMEDLDAWWFKIFRVNRAQILKIFQPVQNITPCLVKVLSMKIWLLVTYTPKKHRL